MKHLVLLVGPPGSGKSTYAEKYVDHSDTEYLYINQDTQGKAEHLNLFNMGLDSNQCIVVDRMNFNKVQRERYLVPAKKVGYKTTIIVLYESFDTCLNRCSNRKDHPTIKNQETAVKAITGFFKNYERVQDSEADEIIRLWPEGYKEKVIVCDLDGTLANIDHRLHYVRGKTGKDKDWKSFFEGIHSDTVNDWCYDIIENASYKIIFCSGRSEEYKDTTKNWLVTNMGSNTYLYNDLYMRLQGDYRQDSIVKEILLEFEIKTRYDIFYVLDDRKQVVDMWRKHGYTCLQCNEGLF